MQKQVLFTRWSSVERKLRQKRRSLLYHRLQRKYSDMHAHATKNRLMRQSRHLTKHSKMEPDICRRKSACIKKTCKDFWSRTVSSWMHGTSLKVERTGEKLTENFANSLTLSILMWCISRIWKKERAGSYRWTYKMRLHPARCRCGCFSMELPTLTVWWNDRICSCYR